MIQSFRHKGLRRFFESGRMTGIQSHLAAARELRDRYLEKVNREGYLFGSSGKYDVTRAIAEPARYFNLAATCAIEHQH